MNGNSVRCVHVWSSVSEVSLLRFFFKPKDGLLDPTGALSTSVLSAAIAQANREVQNPISGDKQKRGPYEYGAGLRAEIGKYAAANTAGSSVGVLDRGCHHCLCV